jgi:hypothetical protein
MTCEYFGRPRGTIHDNVTAFGSVSTEFQQPADSPTEQLFFGTIDVAGTIGPLDSLLCSRRSPAQYHEERRPSGRY